MAGSKLRPGIRLAASTVVEVVVALVLIVLVFGIAMMIFANVTRSSLSARKLTAQAVLNSQLIRIDEQKDFEGKAFVVDQFTVVQEVKPYGAGAGLLEVHLTASDGGGGNVAEARMIMREGVR